jgi:hypothetical protein
VEKGDESSTKGTTKKGHNTVHVWSLRSSISSVLKPMSTDSGESRQVVTDTESDVGRISRPCASADEFISPPLPPLSSQKDDKRLFKQLKGPRQNKKESSPGQSAASSDHDSSQHESGSGSSSDESPIMVQKSQYHVLMAEVQKPARNMDKCDLSTRSHKNFSKDPSSKTWVN